MNSKFQPPQLPVILHRERLFRQVSAMCSKVLITVTAGAGYGKTTLVRDALSRLDIKTVWIRLDPQDMDLMVFMTCLESGIRKVHPEPDNHHRNDSSEKHVLKHKSRLVFEFLKILEKTVQKETVMVLDDYHLVQENKNINEALELMLLHLPAHIHLILISRREPPIRLSRLRAMNRLVEIGEADLSFTAPEIKDFFSKIFNLPVTENHILELQEKTGGWAASLVLFRYALKGKTPREIENCLLGFKGSHRYIFSYLEENIFETQPFETREFMMKAGLLSVIDPEFCNRVFQITNAGIILGRMLEDHLLIFPANENQTLFIFHHLLKDYLTEKTKLRYPVPELNTLHQRIAQEIEPDDIFEALYHYIEGQDYDAAVRVIEANELKFLLEGKIHFLGKCLEKIPGAVVENNPKLLFAQAKLFSYYGSPQEAVLKLKAAYSLFKAKQSPENMVKCLIDIGAQYYNTGYVKEAKLLMEQVLCEVNPSSSTYIIAMTYLIFLTAVLGEFDASEKYTREAGEVIAEYPDFDQRVSMALINTSYTYKVYISGDFDKSRAVNEKLLKIVLDLKAESVLPLVYYQCSATNAALGRFEIGYDDGKKGIQICEKINLQDSKKGWVHIAAAQNCLGLGRFEEAIDHLNASIGIFEMPCNRWGLANAWHCLHQVFVKQKKIGPAKELLFKALDIIDGYELIITEGILENSLAELFIHEGKEKQALDCLNSSRPKLQNAFYYLFENHMLTARSYFLQDLHPEASRHFVQGMKISENRDYFRFIREKFKDLLPLIETDRSRQDSSRFPAWWSASPPGLPPVCTIRLLGRFRLFMGKNEIYPDAWKNSKSLMIFKYLASNRHLGFIPREVLIELLWPDQNFFKTGKRFNVAMSALRKVLEPGLQPKAPSTYILRKKDTYRLCDNDRVIVDVEQFLYESEAARKLEPTHPEQAMDCWRAADSWYKGPFLEEDPYEEWCVLIRDRLNSTYLQILSGMLRFHEKKEDVHACIAHAKKLLKIDPYDESVTKKMMGFYAELGNITAVKKMYTAYQLRAREIDCPVNPETTALLKNLTLHQK
ncbi:MAG: BTAD domain-containing putative transcriptional regulator [Desulfobacula sp.]